MKTLKLDQEEKEILEAYQLGDLKTVKDFKKESKLIRRAAERTVRKSKGNTLIKNCNSKKLD